jgi:hypothetical protein
MVETELKKVFSANSPFKPVFWTHDILMWIRSPIGGFMPLTNGSGSVTLL